MMVKLAGASELMAGFGATNFITKFGAALNTLVMVGGNALTWVGQFIGRFAGIVPVAEEVGTALTVAGGEMTAFGASLTALGGAGIGLAIAAMAGLYLWTGRIKDATDSWVASTDKAVQSAS